MSTRDIIVPPLSPLDWFPADRLGVRRPCMFSFSLSITLLVLLLKSVSQAEPFPPPLLEYLMFLVKQRKPGISDPLSTVAHSQTFLKTMIDISESLI